MDQQKWAGTLIALNAFEARTLFLVAKAINKREVRRKWMSNPFLIVEIICVQGVLIIVGYS